MSVVSLSSQDLQRLTEEAMQSSAKFEEVDAIMTQVLNKQPDNYFLNFWYAGMMAKSGKVGLACALIRRCIELADEWAESDDPHQRYMHKMAMSQCWNNLGTSYRRMHDTDNAERCLLKSLEYNQEDSDHYVNLTTLYVNEGKPAQGEVYGRKALAMNPGHAHAHWNTSLCLLEQGKWAEGFREYVWGQVTGDRPRKRYVDKRGREVHWWDGKPTGTLVVYGEQGVGDEVMFASMVPDLQLLCDRLILDCHPRLEGIFKRSFPGVIIRPTRKLYKEVPDWSSEYDIDAKHSIASTAKWLRYDEVLFPKRPYLEIDWNLADRISNQYSLKQNVVGISWVGGVHSTRKDLRAVHLKEWLPLFKANPDAIWVSLQYTSDHAEHDLKWLKDEHGIDVLRLPEYTETRYQESFDVLRGDEVMRTFTDKYQAKGYAKDNGWEMRHNKGPAFDLDRLFALMACCDAIVTVNNSTAHFAGAAGLKCFTLTPSAPAWRYGMGRRDMPFYSADSVVQYRQTADGWPMDELAYDLQEQLCTGPKLKTAAL